MSKIQYFKNMAATSSYMACTKFSMLGWGGGSGQRDLRKTRFVSISAQQQAEAGLGEAQEEAKMKEEQEKVKQQPSTLPRPVEPQLNVQNKNMSKEFGGQWLSSVTRHVRIYAAYIDRSCNRNIYFFH